jgi:S1-C subfamily serine protease
MKKKVVIIAALLMIVSILASCSLINSSTTSTSTANASGVTTTTKGTVNTNIPSSVLGSVSDLETTLETIYAAVSPSVVLINDNLPATSTSLGGAASGSGFVWDTQGDIVTNNHVIDGATDITVTFSDGTMVNASLVGADSNSDLAVLKVNPSGLNLQPVTLDTNTPIVGQLAIAIGNPYDEQNTLTVGFVSAVGRLIPTPTTENTTGPTYSIPDIIQTDAAINPGSSGGVLLNDSGKVIGITQSFETSSDSSSGVNFAIPASIVEQVIPALINTGVYLHPYLGVTVTSLDPATAAAMNLASGQRGALIEAVTSGSPADKAGLKAGSATFNDNGEQITIGGDVIIGFQVSGGTYETVKSSDDLITYLADQGIVGQPVTLTIIRGGKQMTITVTPAARPTS